MRTTYYSSFCFVGLIVGILAAAQLSTDGLSLSGPMQITLTCGDKWFSTALRLDLHADTADVIFAGALKPRRTYTVASLKSYVPNESFILRFNDGFGGRIRIFKSASNPDLWQAKLIEADKLPARDLGFCYP